MSEILTRVVVDCETGISEEIPLTPEEIEEYHAQAEKSRQQLEQLRADEAARAEAKASATAKLAALGLTPEEIAALN